MARKYDVFEKTRYHLEIYPTSAVLPRRRAHEEDEKELKMLRDKFAPDTARRFTKIRLDKSEKPQYIHTACRIAIDLRASTTTALLQSTRFPKTPTPVTTIADILTLKKQQRFDVIAVPTEVMQKRSARGGLVVADVRLADGSVGLEAKEKTHKTMPLTLFFQNEASFSSFEPCVDRTPQLFVNLNAYVKNDAVEVATIRNTSCWTEATGQKSEDMKRQLPFGTNAVDVAVLPSFTPAEATDYKDSPATLSACSIMDSRASCAALLEDDASEHVYQLNNVYVPQPSCSHNVTIDDRLFARFDCWDSAKKN